MIRRPIESKNLGPFNKLIANLTGSFVTSGTELDLEEVTNIITLLEEKTDSELKETLSQFAIKIEDYEVFINFFKACLTCMNLSLPSNEYRYDKLIIFEPIKRVVRYERFGLHLVLLSKNYLYIDNKPENLKIEIVKNYLRNYTNKDIVLNKNRVIKHESDTSIADLVSIDEPYVICSTCISIENTMLKNDFYSLSEEADHSFRKNPILKNGWRFAQTQDSASKPFFNNNFFITFIGNLRVDEIKHTYWCKNCRSLIFTRLFSKINKHSTEIGFTCFENEEIPKEISIDFPKNFVLSNKTEVENVGSFLIYNNGISSFPIKRVSSTSFSIEKNNGEQIGTMSYVFSKRQLIISLDKNEISIGEDIGNTINTTKNTTFFIDLQKDVFVKDQLEIIEEYELIKSKLTFDDESYIDFIGCIMRNDNLSAPIKWNPEKITFGELKQYTFERAGIDLMLFHDF